MPQRPIHWGINTGKRTLSGNESELVVELLEDLILTNALAYTHQTLPVAPSFKHLP